MGVDSNHTNVLACAATFVALCPIFVALRIFTRKLQKLAIGPDDWLAMSGMVLVVGCGIVMIIGVHVGVFGYRTPKTDPDNASYRMAQQLEWAFFLLVIPALGCIKLSFVFFFRRIFCAGHRRAIFNVTSAIVGVASFIWTVAFFLWFLLSCAPNMADRWTSHQTNNRSCPTDEMSDLALAVSDVVTDVMVFFLPVGPIWGLHMEIKRKMIVLAVFTLGSAALVASIIRLNYFVNVTDVASGKVYDPNFDVNILVTEGLYWSMLEAGLALICCCLTTLKALPTLPGVQSVVRSVRSAVSLQSFSSRSRRRDPGLSRQITSDSRKDLADPGNGLKSAVTRRRSASCEHAIASGPEAGIVHEERGNEIHSRV